MSAQTSKYSTVRDWLQTKSLEGRSARTCECYRQTVDKLGDYLGRDPWDATTQECRAFLAFLKPSNSNVSINNNRRNMNSYFAFLEDEDVIDKSPMRKIHHVKEEKLVKKPFTDEELERLNESASTLKEKAVIAFLSTTACRVGELVGVKIEDVDMQEREVKVLGKGGKERVTFFDAKTKLALESYLADRNDDCPYLFVNSNSRDKHACTTGSIERIVANVGKRAHVDNAHPHRFRRTVATRAIDRGMPIEQVKELLGHSQIQTTMIYATVSAENVKASHRKYLS